MITPNTVQIQLSPKYSADVDTDRYGTYRPVIRVFQDGHITPGQWFASTIVQSTEDIYIDFGAGWKLNTDESALLTGFARGILVALERRMLEDFDR